MNRYHAHHDQVYDSALNMHLTISQSVAVMNGMDADARELGSRLSAAGLIIGNETPYGALLRLIAAAPKPADDTDN